MTLRYNALPCLKANYTEGNYVCTKVGDPANTTKKLKNFCKSNFAKFWPSHFWPSSSPVLKPLDYAL